MYSPNSSTSSLISQDPMSPCSSVDEEEVNCRVVPEWSRYRRLIQSHGYLLHTCREARHHQLVMNESSQEPAKHLVQPWREYPCNGHDDDLYKDPGLPDNLFRGTRGRDGKKLIIKAVGIRSHELDVVQFLSSPTLRRDPANHTIPILDTIEVPQDDIAFIVQEEWPSSFARSSPCSHRGFLYAIRQCIEGLAFMHSHRVAHLDVSLSNVLTNCTGSYAYIDFEMSRRFHAETHPTVRCIRGTELPPEIERGEPSCPFKVDVWALGVMILRACKAAGYDIRGVLMLTQLMLVEDPHDRPSAHALLQEFDRIFSLQESRVHRRRGAPLN